MKSILAAVTLAAAAFSTPAVSQDPDDRFALMQWGLRVAGNADSDQGLISLSEPLCLLVAAEDKALAAKVARRVIDNARGADIRVQRGKCRPNAVVAFADDAQAQLQEMNDKRGGIYGSLYASQLDRMLASEQHGFAFQLEELNPFGGSNLETRTSAARSDLAGALVVIDRAAAEGLDPVQLDDYATLRLLAPTSDLRTLPDDAAAAGSAATTILTLFRDRGNAPTEMTRFDRAYIESLYTLPRGAFARNVMARASRLALADNAPDRDN